MDNAEEIYQLLENDAFSWLEQVDRARISADVIYAALTEIKHLSQTLPGVREKKLAYMQSYMFLTASSFENLLKGIAVTKDPTSWKGFQHGGHGIATFAKEVTTLSDDEHDLLLHLQEFLVWAGRYIIPKTPNRFTSGQQLRTLRGSDPPLAAALFERLSSILHDRIAQRTQAT